jgi:hypothetical protein
MAVFTNPVRLDDDPIKLPPLAYEKIEAIDNVAGSRVYD